MTAVVMFGVVDPPPDRPNAQVSFELVAPGVTGSVLDGDVQVFAPEAVPVDADTGRWEVTIDYPVSDPAMIPQGCVMRSTLQATRRRPAVDVWTVPFGAGAGPFFIGDYLTDPPGALTPSALAAEIARATAAENALALSLVTVVSGGTPTSTPSTVLSGGSPSSTGSTVLYGGTPAATAPDLIDGGRF